VTTNTTLETQASGPMLERRAVADGDILTTDGPFVAVKESLGGIPGIEVDPVTRSGVSAAEQSNHSG
jgi:hypothetical protein